MMRFRNVAAIFLLCLTLTLAHAQQKKKPGSPKAPCSNALNQMDMNRCFCDEYHKSDAELNRVYQQVLAANQASPLKIEKLKAAQRAWMSFRDAQMEAFYPTTGEDPRLTYGSVYQMCYCITQQTLTEDRTKQLKRMLDAKEGDVCG